MEKSQGELIYSGAKKNKNNTYDNYSFCLDKKSSSIHCYVNGILTRELEVDEKVLEQMSKLNEKDKYNFFVEQDPINFEKDAQDEIIFDNEKQINTKADDDKKTNSNKENLLKVANDHILIKEFNKGTDNETMAEADISGNIIRDTLLCSCRGYRLMKLNSGNRLFQREDETKNNNGVKHYKIVFESQTYDYDKFIQTHDDNVFVCSEPLQFSTNVRQINNDGVGFETSAIENISGGKISCLLISICRNIWKKRSQAVILTLINIDGTHYEMAKLSNGKNGNISIDIIDPFHKHLIRRCEIKPNTNNIYNMESIEIKQKDIKNINYENYIVTTHQQREGFTCGYHAVALLFDELRIYNENLLNKAKIKDESTEEINGIENDNKILTEELNGIENEFRLFYGKYEDKENNNIIQQSSNIFEQVFSNLNDLLSKHLLFIENHSDFCKDFIDKRVYKYESMYTIAKCFSRYYKAKYKNTDQSQTIKEKMIIGFYKSFVEVLENSIKKITNINNNDCFTLLQNNFFLNETDKDDTNLINGFKKMIHSYGERPYNVKYKLFNTIAKSFYCEKGIKDNIEIDYTKYSVERYEENKKKFNNNRNNKFKINHYEKEFSPFFKRFSVLNVVEKYTKQSFLSLLEGIQRYNLSGENSKNKDEIIDSIEDNSRIKETENNNIDDFIDTVVKCKSSNDYNKQQTITIDFGNKQQYKLNFSQYNQNNKEIVFDLDKIQSEAIIQTYNKRNINAQQYNTKLQLIFRVKTLKNGSKKLSMFIGKRAKNNKKASTICEGIFGRMPLSKNTKNIKKERIDNKKKFGLLVRSNGKIISGDLDACCLSSSKHFSSIQEVIDKLKKEREYNNQNTCNNKNTNIKSRSAVLQDLDKALNTKLKFEQSVGCSCLSGDWTIK